MAQEQYKTLSFVLILISVFLLFLFLGGIFLGKPMNEQKQTLDTKMTQNNSLETQNSTDTIVVFETSKGNFEIKLYSEESPITAGNFEKLVKEGFYDGQRFHRVIPNFMVQGGDPLSKNESMKSRWGTGGPGYSIQDEYIEGLSNKRGTIAMANSGPNSGGSQFFINVVDNTYLDWDKAPSSSKHPVFGEVISGMDIVDAIANAATDSADRPLQDIVVTRAYIK